MLQLADIVCSSVVFPMLINAFGDHLVDSGNIHVSDKYITIRARYKDAIKNMQTIVTRLKIDEHAYKLIYKTLHLGDMFVEIINSKQYLIQTLYNMGVPLKESTLGPALAALHTTRNIASFQVEAGRSKITISVDETVPLHEQFSKFHSVVESLYESAEVALRETTMNFTLKSKQIPPHQSSSGYTPDGVYALNNDPNTAGSRDISITNMRHMFDQYATKGSISNISLKFIDPWNIIVIEHDMKFVSKIADKVTVLHLGKLLAEGSMEEIRQNPKVIDVYLGH